MKKIVLFLMVIVSSQIKAQISESNLIGEWIEVSSEMQDGSPVNMPYKSNDYRLSFSFVNKNSLLIKPLSVYPQNAKEVFYSIRDFPILATPDMNYEIEELTGKTLVLTEVSSEIEANKLKRYFLTRKEVIHQRKKEENRDSVLVAEKYFTPTMKKYTDKMSLLKKTSKTPYRTKGLYVIDLENEESLVFLDSLDLKKKKHIEKEMELLTEVFAVPFMDWNLEGFEEYSKIEIPFVLDNREVDGRFEMQIVHFTEDISVFDSYYGPSLKEKEKAYMLYQKGIEAFHSQKFKEAIKLFTDSFAIDTENLDALYNKAVVYFHTEDLNNACQIWRELKNLGQIRAEKLLEKHCK